MLNPTFNLTGRITEPTIHNFEGEYCAVSFSVATTTTVKKDGKFEEKTVWYPCKAIMKKTDGRIPYMKKGILLLLAVSYEPEEWTGEDSKQKSRPMFMVKEFQLGPKLAPAEGGNSESNANKPAKSEASTKSETPKQEKVPEIDVDEDEIPF